MRILKKKVKVIEIHTSGISKKAMIAKKKPKRDDDFPDNLEGWKQRFLHDEKIWLNPEDVNEYEGYYNEERARLFSATNEEDFKAFLLHYMDGCEEDAAYVLFLMFSKEFENKPFKKMAKLFTDEEILEYFEYARKYYSDDYLKYMPKKFWKMVGGYGSDSHGNFTHGYMQISFDDIKYSQHLTAMINKSSIKREIKLFKTDNNLVVDTIELRGKKMLARNEEVDKMLLQLIDKVNKDQSKGILSFAYTKNGSNLELFHATISAFGANMNPKNLARWGYESARVFGMLSDAYFRGGKEYQKWIPKLFSNGLQLKQEVYFWAELVDAKELKELKDKLRIDGLRLIKSISRPKTRIKNADEHTILIAELEKMISEGKKGKIKFDPKSTPRAKAFVVGSGNDIQIDLIVDNGKKEYEYYFAYREEGKWNLEFYRNTFKLPITDTELVREELNKGKSFWEDCDYDTEPNVVIMKLFDFSNFAENNVYNIQIIKMKSWNEAKIVAEINDMANWVAKNKALVVDVSKRNIKGSKTKKQKQGFQFNPDLPPRAKALIIGQHDNIEIHLYTDYGDKTYGHAFAFNEKGNWDMNYYQSRFELPVMDFDKLIETLSEGKGAWDEEDLKLSVNDVIKKLYDWLIAAPDSYNVQIIKMKKFDEQAVLSAINDMANWYS